MKHSQTTLITVALFTAALSACTTTGETYTEPAQMEKSEMASPELAPIPAPEPVEAPIVEVISEPAPQQPMSDMQDMDVMDAADDMAVPAPVTEVDAVPMPPVTCPEGTKPQDNGTCMLVE